jgi:hypothetical protein
MSLGAGPLTLKSLPDFFGDAENVGPSYLALVGRVTEPPVTKSVTKGGSVTKRCGAAAAVSIWRCGEFEPVLATAGADYARHWRGFIASLCAESL